MDVHDFHKDFLEEIKATAATEGAGSNAAFVSVATSYLVNAEVLSDFIPAFYLGTGKKNRKIRVDGYVLDEFDLTFNLIISDYTGDEQRETITKTLATTLFERLLYFIEEVYDGKLRKEIEPSPAFTVRGYPLRSQMATALRPTTKNLRRIPFTCGLQMNASICALVSNERPEALCRRLRIFSASWSSALCWRNPLP